MDYILRTTGLSTCYRAKKAVNQVDLHVYSGDIYGFLGQNGAGETTTIRMIMGLIRPSEGGGVLVRGSNDTRPLQPL